MSAQHTPGPWVAHPTLAYIIPAAHANRPIGGHEDDKLDLERYAQEICALHNPDRHRPEAETWANARLIAAAPCLLEALQGLEPYLDAIVCYASTQGEHEPNRLAVAARAAISRALPGGEGK